MDHATKSEATRGSSALPYSDGRSTAAPFHRVRHGLFTAAFSIIPFSFIVLFAALREVNRQPSTDSPRKMRSRSTFRDGTPCLATQPRRRCRTAPLRLAQLGRSNSRESAACQRRACMRVNWRS